MASIQTLAQAVITAATACDTSQATHLANIATLRNVESALKVAMGPNAAMHNAGRGNLNLVAEGNISARSAGSTSLATLGTAALSRELSGALG